MEENGPDLMPLKKWREINSIGYNLAYKMVKDGLPIYQPSERKIFVLVKDASEWLSQQKDNFKSK